MRYEKKQRGEERQRVNGGRQCQEVRIFKTREEYGFL
jgi:hypothetical protein